MSFSDQLEGVILDHVFGNVPYVPPTTLYIGLSSVDPTDTGSSDAPPAGNNYARVGLANNKTNFSNAAGGMVNNLVDILFPAATGLWGTMRFFTIYSASTGGTLLGSGPLSASITPNAGDAVRIPAGQLQILLD